MSRDLSGAENIRLNCAIFGLNKDQIHEVYPKIVEFSELEEFINTPVKFYSSGMKARLGFSIAIHIHADIILIDEVLAVGDKDFKKKCYAKMEELRNSGKTLVIVSHSLSPLKKHLQSGDDFGEGTSQRNRGHRYHPRQIPERGKEKKEERGVIPD